MSAISVMPTRFQASIVRNAAFYSRVLEEDDLRSLIPEHKHLKDFIEHLSTYERWLFNPHIFSRELEGLRECIGLSFPLGFPKAQGSSSQIDIPQTKPGPHQAVQLCGLIASYKLLDILIARNGPNSFIPAAPAKAMAWPVGAEKIHVDAICSVESKPLTAFQGMNEMADWPNLVLRLKVLYDSINRGGRTPSSTSPSKSIAVYLSQLSDKGDISKIETNILVASLNLSYILRGKHASAADGEPPVLTSSFHLDTMAASEAPEEQEVRRILEQICRSTVKNSSDRPSHLRSPLHVCILLTPVFMLLQSYVVGKNYNRYILYMLSQALGNEKPVLLKLVEHALWTVIDEVARGILPPYQALDSLMRRLPTDDILALPLDDPSRFFFRPKLQPSSAGPRKIPRAIAHSSDSLSPRNPTPTPYPIFRPLPDSRLFPGQDADSLSASLTDPFFSFPVPPSQNNSLAPFYGPFPDTSSHPIPSSSSSSTGCASQAHLQKTAPSRPIPLLYSTPTSASTALEKASSGAPAEISGAGGVYSRSNDLQTDYPPSNIHDLGFLPESTVYTSNEDVNPQYQDVNMDDVFDMSGMKVSMDFTDPLFNNSANSVDLRQSEQDAAEILANLQQAGDGSALPVHRNDSEFTDETFDISKWVEEWFNAVGLDLMDCRSGQPASHSNPVAVPDSYHGYGGIPPIELLATAAYSMRDDDEPWKTGIRPDQLVSSSEGNPLLGEGYILQEAADSLGKYGDVASVSQSISVGRAAEIDQPQPSSLQQALQRSFDANDGTERHADDIADAHSKDGSYDYDREESPMQEGQAADDADADMQESDNEDVPMSQVDDSFNRAGSAEDTSDEQDEIVSSPEPYDIDDALMRSRDNASDTSHASNQDSGEDDGDQLPAANPLDDELFLQDLDVRHLIKQDDLEERSAGSSSEDSHREVESEDDADGNPQPRPSLKRSRSHDTSPGTRNNPIDVDLLRSLDNPVPVFDFVQQKGFDLLDLQNIPPRSPFPATASTRGFDADGQEHIFDLDAHQNDYQDRIMEFLDVAQESYVGGKPLHISEPEKSIFHIMTFEEREKMSIREMQSLLSRKVIVETGRPRSNKGFDLETFNGFRALNSLVSIQDFSAPGVDGHASMPHVVRGTVHDLYKNLKWEEKGKILNALEFTVWNPKEDDQPFDTARVAWHETVDKFEGCSNETPFPIQDLLFALIGTRSTMSFTHIDCSGWCTFVDVIRGLKYWGILVPKDPNRLFTIDAFLKDFQIDRMGPTSAYRIEFIVLREGDRMWVFIWMGPNTPHAVLGLAKTITQGGHFYACQLLRYSAAAIVHAFSLNDYVTNSTQVRSRIFLRRILLFYYNYLFENEPIHLESVRVHLPDMDTISGYLDVLSLCNICIMGNVLDFRTYLAPNQEPENDVGRIQRLAMLSFDRNNVPSHERVTYCQTRGVARVMLEEINAHYVLHDQNGDIIEDFPFRYLADQLQSLCIYKQDAEDNDLAGAPHCTVRDVRRQCGNLAKWHPIVEPMYLDAPVPSRICAAVRELKGHSIVRKGAVGARKDSKS
ncbi:hypothetical protein CVT24_008149 [Panaeolus cyanescens]|uniref:JmjC domain-containing protein n=1 Tax=Panaeolus cyanescens TaxID=181874 RepID=A0A409W4M5_9AGAR|nr:hypothetical protein CVT24_008149 [Panaeolus cyanescens]